MGNQPVEEDTPPWTTIPNRRRAVVRNGYQPKRKLQTRIGDVPIQVLKTRDRYGSGMHFSSALLLQYLRRTRSVEALRPWR
jgi:hypothetical protein